MSSPATPVSIDRALAGLTFFAHRIPTTTDADAAGAFAEVARYREGAVFVGQWAGASERERHPLETE